MSKRTGRKNLSKSDRHTIKELIREYESLRLKDNQILVNLKEKGFNIGNTTLYKLKKELRSELGERLECIGRHELLYEHFLAIQMLQELQRSLWDIMKDSETSTGEKIKISSELRSLIKDMTEFYGSTDVVESVFKYFQENYAVP